MGVPNSIATGLGPFQNVLGTPSSTIPMTGPGIANSTVGTTPAKVLSAATSPRGRVRKVKIVCVTGGGTLAWSTVFNSLTGPTTMTATGGGTATDGSFINAAMGGVEYIAIPDNMDLYLVAAAAATAYQLTVDEVGG